MKNILLLCLALSASQNLCAQQKRSELPKVFINKDVTTFFILSEPITMADISNGKIAGDQPVPNVLRIKPIVPEKGDGDKFVPGSFQGVVTIIAQKYLVQYALIYASAEKAHKNLTIGSRDGIGLVNPAITMSLPEMKAFCLQALKKKKTRSVGKSSAHGISAKVNNIFTVGDYFFIDVTFRNRTNIKYDIGQVRFKIADKRKVKRTNFQEVEIEKVYSLYERQSFKRKYRNVYVFKKFTFPNQKVFTIALSEEQVSGRDLTLEIDYSDLLNADTL